MDAFEFVLRMGPLPTVLLGSIVTILFGVLLTTMMAFLTEEPEELGALSLSELLDELNTNDDILLQTETMIPAQWDLIIRRLQRHPEEAAAFCHTVDPSPLQQCLSLPTTIIPVRVIRAFLEAYEDAAFNADRHGVTPLAVAVKATTTTTAAEEEDDVQSTSNDNSEIVQALLQVHSGAVSHADNTGRLPLHYVRSDVTTAERLLRAYPEGASVQDKQGRLPLHYYCCGNTNTVILTDLDTDGDDDDHDHDNTLQQQQQQQLGLPDPQIARLLLLSSPSQEAAAAVCRALVQDKNGMTPLAVLYQTLKELLQQEQTIQQQECSTTSTAWKHHRDILWQILTILVQSAASSTSDTTSATTATATNDVTTKSFRIVHALVSLRCPANVMKEALRRFPEQAVQRDEQGRTPLLIAVAMLDARKTPDSRIATLSASTRAASTAIAATKVSNNNSSTDEIPAVICELLQGNAAAAARMTDTEGRLAIDSLAEQGVYDEQLFEAMVRAEPRAVDTRDLKNKQHPFLTAALAGEKSNIASVYHLLRAQPHVIRCFLSES